MEFGLEAIFLLLALISSAKCDTVAGSTTTLYDECFQEGGCSDGEDLLTIQGINSQEECLEVRVPYITFT